MTKAESAFKGKERLPNHVFMVSFFFFFLETNPSGGDSACPEAMFDGQSIYAI